VLPKKHKTPVALKPVALKPVALKPVAVNKVINPTVVRIEKIKQPVETKKKKDTRLPRVIPIIDLQRTDALLLSNADVQGTFCGVINKQLITAQCPLPKGTCFWKHRSTGYCKYRTDTNLTIQSLATLVGEHVPNEETVASLKSELLEAVRRELH
jgi:hypothetical protein